MSILVKLGGSLLDLPDLGPRLAAFLNAQPPGPPLLVVGGGAGADRIRELDRAGRFYRADQAHWLAIRAMTSNDRRVAAMLSKRKQPK